MLFNSLNYLIFFPVVLLAYWLAPNYWRRFLLLFASYVFYMSWLPIYGVLLIALSAINYGLALAISAFREQAKSLLIVGLVANLGTLCFYKYTNFLVKSVSDFFAISSAIQPQLQGKHFDVIHFDIILPLGISFFAFEFIHYLTDVYKGGKPITSVVDFGLFAAFFPSQIAGPIKRYQDFVLQLSKPIYFEPQVLLEGLALIMQGLFKKVALSDNLAPLVTLGFGQTSVGALDTWVAALAFAFQIYLDFSGYTDMGRGSAMMLGYSLPDNFNLPYLAKNLSDFWKRWHISLSSWLRDYLYIPLGGGRITKWRKHLNLMITMVLGGLWHGAAWHYIAWGALHGAGLVVAHQYSDLVRKVPALQRFHQSKAGTACSIALTFFVVLVGWVFFRAETVSQSLEVLRRMFSCAPSEAVIQGFVSSTLPVSLSVYCVYAALIIGDRYCGKKLFSNVPLRDFFTTSVPIKLSTCAAAWILSVGFAPSRAEPFIYFQF